MFALINTEWNNKSLVYRKLAINALKWFYQRNNLDPYPPAKTIPFKLFFDIMIIFVPINKIIQSLFYVSFWGKTIIFFNFIDIGPGL